MCAWCRSVADHLHKQEYFDGVEICHYCAVGLAISVTSDAQVTVKGC